jgi:hypothetical protein
MTGILKASDNSGLKNDLTFFNNAKINVVQLTKVTKNEMQCHVLVAQTTVTSTFTDECGVQWTATTTCTCTVTQALQDQATYIHDHTDMNGCIFTS